MPWPSMPQETIVLSLLFGDRIWDRMCARGLAEIYEPFENQKAYLRSDWRMKQVSTEATLERLREVK